MSKIAVNSMRNIPILRAVVQPNASRMSELLAGVETRMLNLVRPIAADLLVPAQAFYTCTDFATTAGDASYYHLQAGGQRMRARLALHASVALGLSEADAITIAAAVELLHNASLIHDDLQDRDTSRRGRETAWFRFGDNAAICSGDLMLSAAYAALATFSKSQYIGQLLITMHANTAAAVEGQLVDLNMAAINHQNSERYDISAWLSYYKKIAQAKSGALLRLPLELALTGAGMAEHAHLGRNAANAFALGYQIADDISDVEHDRGTAVATSFTPLMNANIVAEKNAPTPNSRCNIVLLLEQQQSDRMASCHSQKDIKLAANNAAKALAQEHLETAIAHSKMLPCSAGAFLQELAQKLATKLANTKLH